MDVDDDGDVVEVDDYLPTSAICSRNIIHITNDEELQGLRDLSNEGTRTEDVEQVSQECLPLVVESSETASGNPPTNIKPDRTPEKQANNGFVGWIWQVGPLVWLANVLVLIAATYLVPWHWLEHVNPLSRANRQVVAFTVGSARLTDENGFKVTFSRLHNDEEVLLGDLGLSTRIKSSSKICDKDKKKNVVSCSWKDGTKMLMSQVSTTSPQLHCTKHVWKAVLPTDMLKDCFDMGEANWYGGGGYYFKSCAVDNESQDETAFIIGDTVQNPHTPYKSVEERFWLSSKGLAIHVSPLVPLFVSVNQRKKGWLCLVAKNYRPYGKKRKKPKLSYTVCVGRDMVHTYREAVKLLFKRPRRIPDRKIFKNPIWTTGAKYGKYVTQDNVTNFARAIVRHQFPYSLMEIDGQWQECPGDLEFDLDAFPNPTALMHVMDFLQFRVSLRVHPFCNLDCRTFTRGVSSGRWVQNATGQPAIVEWWNGVGSMVDVTNETTALWWTKRLRQVQLDYGVQSFNFDGGEASWVPENAILAAPQSLQPNAYTTEYARVAVRFGTWAGLRVAHRSHTVPLFVRVLDRSSSTKEKAIDDLRLLIPTVLHCSLLGYPFVAPAAVALKGDREVYVRWMQISAFLPAMRFSIPPWDYDPEVVDMAHRMVALHHHYYSYVQSLAVAATKDGIPIIRPLWWIAPNDQIAQTQDSEFLVGDDLLVAPIVNRGMYQRDIYLPRGVWRDEVQGGIISGPAWLWNYPAQLNQVPHFTLLGKYLR